MSATGLVNNSYFYHFTTTFLYTCILTYYKNYELF
jgi:hypothetical protein